MLNDVTKFLHIGYKERGFVRIFLGSVGLKLRDPLYEGGFLDIQMISNSATELPLRHLVTDVLSTLKCCSIQRLEAAEAD